MGIWIGIPINFKIEMLNFLRTTFTNAEQEDLDQEKYITES